MSWLELEEKVAIVTGSLAGIGKELAVALAETGCTVVVADIRDCGDKMLAELDGGADKHLYVKTDVTNASSVSALVKHTIEKCGRLDVLVNNAGINMPCLLVDPADAGGKYELNESSFGKMVAVNQLGPFLCAQAAARAMIEAGTKGVIINMTSECGLEGSEGQSCYAATKGALYAFTRSWAKELGKHGIRVVGVAPGILEKTDLRTPDYEEALAYTRGITVQQLRDGYQKVTVPIGRSGKLREVADLVCFLASDRSSYTTGTTYNVSGGKTRA